MSDVIPAVYTRNESGVEFVSEAEGGFRYGDKVKIIDPSDGLCGRSGVIESVSTERTVIVAIKGGGTFRFCVGALERS